jgi:hypothetical protein
MSRCLSPARARGGAEANDCRLGGDARSRRAAWP